MRKILMSGLVAAAALLGCAGPAFAGTGNSGTAGTGAAAQGAAVGGAVAWLQAAPSHQREPPPPAGSGYQPGGGPRWGTVMAAFWQGAGLPAARFCTE